MTLPVPRPTRESSFTQPVGALVPTTLVDFPGCVAASLFLTGCNLRCPYCHNGDLVLHRVSAGQLVSLEQTLAHLKKRRAVLTGFAISGGEPLLFPHLATLIAEAKSLGYNIKLDTNGTLPDRLRMLMENPATAPDFIAMDIKTDPDRYTILEPHPNAIPDIAQRLVESARLIATLPADRREWRTVLVPPLVGKSDIAAMAALLPAEPRAEYARS
ncbi:MAG: anaerobic ribonucleoside-triphosphate reductase activating protein, partial [Treponemataceae bacterium]|nr:anaerobic ribonucleoside-triphosphate reductase activating protein [Treponemataceae bacterium]